MSWTIGTELMLATSRSYEVASLRLKRSPKRVAPLLSESATVESRKPRGEKERDREADASKSCSQENSERTENGVWALYINIDL